MKFDVRQYFFLKKNVRSFCIAKASLIFFKKNIRVHVKVLKHLTSYANNALNNWALVKVHICLNCPKKHPDSEDSDMSASPQ